MYDLNYSAPETRELSTHIVEEEKDSGSRNMGSCSCRVRGLSRALHGSVDGLFREEVSAAGKLLKSGDDFLDTLVAVSDFFCLVESLEMKEQPEFKTRR